MDSAAATRRVSDAGDLYARVGAFLSAHRLSPDPLHYAFAHAVLSGTDPALTAEVARLTDGGVRLMQADILRLGGQIGAGAPQRERLHAPDPVDPALAAQTQAQVDGFADIVRGMHDQTRVFGKDLAQSVAAFERVPAAGRPEVTRIAEAMIQRVRDSEERLAQATDEADALRAKLADAHQVARRDPLTGLANRLALSEALAACATNAGPCCLALCDIDRFKRINDKHGHNVGDRVLRAIADTLATVCDGHVVSRHGGEEFAVLLNGITLTAAAALIDEARATVAARRFRTRDTDTAIGSVTFSAGITAMRHDEPIDQVFDRADRLLYTAKAQGRDRTCAE
jgi:diguanylate cyclase